SQAPEEVAAELDYFRSLLKQIVTIVCSGDQARIAHLISIIRANPSDTDIYALLNNDPAINNDSDDEQDESPREENN
ncbi:uncharacterized protein BO95DRAFT_377639, partial [Aspergillus brunneoviolaceus CBS 621.78]